MIKKVIEISQAKTNLSIRYNQLIIEQENRKATIPCEDIGILCVHHSGVSYTHSVFTELLKNGAVIIFCGETHHPTGVLLPLEGNSIQTERFRSQVEAKQPLKKRLWKQLIQAKIKHQAKIIGKESEAYKSLMVMSQNVLSGDTANVEAQASKKYWSYFLKGVQFKRDIDGDPPNNLLNYGYMVLRAAIARALCSTGLHPSLGIHHTNKYNAFCLADDMLEPFRGFIESKVKQIYETGIEINELSKSLKAEILSVLNQEIKISDYSGPLMVGLHRTSASLARCFSGKQKMIDLPEL